MAVPTILQAVLSDDVKRILDQFRECFGIRIVFYDASRQLLKSGLDQPDCRYCQLVQKLYGPEPCLKENECGRIKATESGTLTTYQCHAGLIEAILPIREGSCLLGYAMIGQIRSNRQMPAHIARDWSEHHNSDLLRKAYYGKDLVPKHRLDSILSLFSICADYIVKNHLVKLSINSNLGQVLEYMQAHIHESVTLVDAARHVGSTPFAISHAFTRQLGQSFKHIQIEMKLTTAEDLMRADPDLTVTQVAMKIGYDDPFYFSRIYRKHRGIPPSAFLAQHRPTP